MPDSQRDIEELDATEVGELTHAELLCLYQDAEQNIRFSKLLQWRMTGGTLALFVLIVLLTPFDGKDGTLTRMLTFLTPVIAMAAIYALVIFQFWQGTEREKIRLVLGNLSSLARAVYHTKSTAIANVERWILFGFMAGLILTGGFTALSRQLRWFAP